MDKLRGWAADWRGAIVVGAALIVAALIVTPALRTGSAGGRESWAATTLLVAALSGTLLGLVSVRAYWHNVVGGEPNKPLTTLAALLGFGTGVTFWYGWAGQNGGVAVAVLLLGVLLATTFVGGSIGFLFGIPRFDYGDRAPTTSQADASGASSSPPIPNPVAGSSSNRARYRPSTNLDEIADWLTKIIVGLGLTHLLQLGPGLRSVASYIVSGCTPGCSNEPFVAAVIVFSALAGFLFGYMWTRLHYAMLAARSDSLTVEIIQQNADQKPRADRSTRSDETTTPRDAVDDDPNKGKFGGKAATNDRALRAAIEPSGEQPGLYKVRLAVSSTNPKNLLTETVTFHLHPTFAKEEVTRPVVNGVAGLTLLAYGGFTVGATADGGKTKLELDLAEHPEAPADFRAR